MKLNFAVKAVLGALALGAAGAVSAANVSSSISTGSVVLDIVDTTSGLSYFYDTGLAQSGTGTLFDQNSNYSFTLSDANYTAFLAKAGSDSLSYSVVSAKGTGGVGTYLFTGAAGGTATTSGARVSNALTSLNSYYSGLNGYTDASNTVTGNSVYAQSSISTAAYYGQYSASLNTDAGASATGAVGSSLAFYSAANSSSNKTSNITNIAESTLAGTWDLVNGVLTYTAGSSAVPLPPSVLLMLSGLGMLAIIGRRKSTRDLTIHGMVA